MAAPVTKSSKEKRDLTVWSEGAKSLNFIKHDWILVTSYARGKLTITGKGQRTANKC